MTCAEERRQQPPRMRLIIDEGGDGEAVCTCGCRFVWSYADYLNIVFDGDGAVRVICPRCHMVE